MMHLVENVLSWSLLIVGGVIGTAMIVVGMLEALPDIVRDGWNGVVHH